MTSMRRTLPLLRRDISLSTAIDDDDNILQELSYPKQRVDFYVYLYQHRSVIESIVSYHLNLSKKQTCRVGDVKEWISGSFNVCIPVDINGRVLIRFPLLYKVGEGQHPGNADEKLRCEAATYVWIRQNCPSIPIPRLWGFAFAQDLCFLAIEHANVLSRLRWCFHNMVSFVFGFPVRPPYLSRRCPFNLTTGYLLMEYVGNTDTVMLSESWDKSRHDHKRRSNLFRGLSRIIISLAQSPFNRIGSLTMNNQGNIKLTNRPLTLRLHQLENESIPTNVDRDLTYSTSDSYYMDLLSCHDSRLPDGEAQMSALTIMRALLPHFTCRDYRRGPFIMTLTDLHQSNIFVDRDWNIKSLVDLEWTCSLPIEMLRPPYWLTSRGVDQIYGEHLDTFSDMHAEFMHVFDQEEQAYAGEAGARALNLTSIMKKGWGIGNFWYFHALETPKGLYNIFSGSHTTKFERTISPYWAPDVQEFLDGKMNDKEVYEGHLRDAFAGAEEG
ncbi:uncharacterized protein BO88DRAFT_439965 [Aspergillus vadensis CBS 113365]|uniref:Aminoglycoside phosphotransferase domain-containing protein n=1 Tax=Aspergillus vadensis (strain CBS 113365 / IMI 142717 / IBT 24658) TaxID=1448311 RepID=A0A319BTA9_ASPVC|nr:hypothetical protein BO88DRAFT_439965 [Aspergillus vadensis CBS 113365]PYH74510.1 hypothetical protein BO88DRAFT_439965 [Aspergillus vadensis CBS 113365]